MKKSQKTLYKRRFRLFLPFSLALAAALLAAPVVFPASEALSLPSFAALPTEELSGNVLTLPGGGGEGGGEGEIRSSDGETAYGTDGETAYGTDGETANGTDGETAYGTDGETATGTADGTQSGADDGAAEAPGEKSVDVRGVFLILLISAATVSGIVSGIPRKDRV